jgi:hypothetical protein
MPERLMLQDFEVFVSRQILPQFLKQGCLKTYILEEKIDVVGKKSILFLLDNLIGNIY